MTVVSVQLGLEDKGGADERSSDLTTLRPEDELSPPTLNTGDDESSSSGKRLEDDLAWFLLHLQALSAEIGEQFVAVKDRKIVAHAATMPELREQLQRLGIKRPLITRSGLTAWEPMRW
jgi:hypothetical protein